MSQTESGIDMKEYMTKEEREEFTGEVSALKRAKEVLAGDIDPKYRDLIADLANDLEEAEATIKGYDSLLPKVSGGSHIFCCQDGKSIEIRHWQTGEYRHYLDSHVDSLIVSRHLHAHLKLKSLDDKKP
jgi:hypothetical protein